MIEITSNVRPALVNTGGKTYLVPIWMEVPADFDVEKNVKVTPITPQVTKEETMTFGSKSDPTIKYETKRLVAPSGDVKYTCTCPGYWRVKDKSKGCKHIQKMMGLSKG